MSNRLRDRRGPSPRYCGVCGVNIRQCKPMSCIGGTPHIPETEMEKDASGTIVECDNCGGIAPWNVSAGSMHHCGGTWRSKPIPRVATDAETERFRAALSRIERLAFQWASEALDDAPLSAKFAALGTIAVEALHPKSEADEMDCRDYCK